MFKKYCAFLIVFLILCSVVFFSPYSEAAEKIGEFSLAEGKVDVLKGGELPASSAKAGDPLFVKDVVRTKSGSRADILFTDGNIVKISQRSRIDISEYMPNKGVINLPRGKVEASVKLLGEAAKSISDIEGANRFEIHTPNAVAGVRGTHYFVSHLKNVSVVFVKEGNVYTYNPRFPASIVIVPAGNITIVPMAKSPLTPRLATGAELSGFEKGGASGEKQSSSEKTGGGTESSSSETGGGAASSASGAGGGAASSASSAASDAASSSASEAAGGAASSAPAAAGGTASSASGAAGAAAAPPPPPPPPITDTAAGSAASKPPKLPPPPPPPN